MNKEVAAPYLASCSYELSRILARLKKGIKAEEHADGLIQAAAAQVNFTLVSVALLSGEGDFSIGDISVKNMYTRKLEAAEALKRDAFSAIVPILTDEGFAFIGARS